MWAIGAVLVGRLATTLVLGGGPAEAPPPSDTVQAVHLLQRATYGVRPQDIDEVLRLGTEGWLERQLHPETIAEPRLAEILSDYPAALLPGSRVYRIHTPPRLGEPSPGDTRSREERARERQRQANQGRAQARREIISARLMRAVHSERQLQEVMVGFWIDHFNIYINKGAVRWLTADFERNAIRPNIFGTFEELLVAVASHPAMLIYLDNWNSSAEPAPRRQAQARGGQPNLASGPLDARQGSSSALPPTRQRRGINENYARELLELHTLGVNGGYTQQDVIEVARAFTGWSVTRPSRNSDDEPYQFIFRRGRHDRGSKQVLGLHIRGGGGQEDGLAVLQMLARHPSTARHISYKLVERFVSDSPPEELVDELTAVFLRTGGDLRQLTRTLFTSPIFRDSENIGARIKRPFELVTSTLRATDAEVARLPGLLRVLRTFGQEPYMELAPVGYPAQKADWVNSGAMLNRMNFGLDLAAGKVPGVVVRREDWWRAALRAGSMEELVSGLTGRFLPGVRTTELEEIILADLAGVAERKPSVLVARALGLILGSPEFQRH